MRKMNILRHRDCVEICLVFGSRYILFETFSDCLLLQCQHIVFLSGLHTSIIFDWITSNGKAQLHILAPQLWYGHLLEIIKFTS